MGEMDNGNGLLRPLRSLMALREPASLIAEQYRILLSRLLRIRKTRPLHRIGITSAIQGEGKTTVAFNLAITMARAYKMKVLLIEMDLKKPSFPSILTSGRTTGLADTLDGGVVPATLLRYTLDGKLAILPAGFPKEESSSLFISEKLQIVLEKFRDDFEYILMDLPPVLPLADVGILEEVMDGILFVVQADRTPRSLVSRALSMLPSQKLLGLVFNNLRTDAPFSNYYYYHTARRNAGTGK